MLKQNRFLNKIYIVIGATVYLPNLSQPNCIKIRDYNRQLHKNILINITDRQVCMLNFTPLQQTNGTPSGQSHTQFLSLFKVKLLPPMLSCLLTSFYGCRLVRKLWMHFSFLQHLVIFLLYFHIFLLCDKI